MILIALPVASGGKECANGTLDGRRAFLRALERFQDVKSFFCNSMDLSPGHDRTHPEISRSPDIFGEDYEIQVTLHGF
jgi:hypothetical protein